MKKIPEDHHNMAAAFYCKDPVAQNMWSTGNEDNIAKELRMEGHSTKFRRTAIDYVRTQRSLIADYVAGRISKRIKVPDALVQGIKMPAKLNADRTHKLAMQYQYAKDVDEGRKDVEGRIWRGDTRKIQEGDVLLMNFARARVAAIHHFKGFRDMLQEMGYQRALPDATSLTQAVRTYHKFRNYKELAAKYGVVALELEAVHEEPEQEITLAPLQRTA
eukprot:10667462-Karenia_brevis.AAC.1